MAEPLAETTLLRGDRPHYRCPSFWDSSLCPQSTAGPSQCLDAALERAQWEPLVERFEEENPDIRLEIVEGPNATNLVEDLYTSAFLLGDSIYDLVYMDIVWTPKFAAAGWLDPLDDRVSEEELSEFLEGDVEGGRFEGQLYRMPFRSDAGMLYYRSDLLEENGFEAPDTTEELIEISRALQDQGAVEWGYVWQGRQYEGLAAVFVEILEGHGGFWVDPDTEEVGLDEPEAIAAMEFLVQTIDDGISPRGVTTYQEEEPDASSKMVEPSLCATGPMS